MFLIALRRRPGHAAEAETFPWSLPLVRDLDALDVHRAGDLPGRRERLRQVHPAGRASPPAWTRSPPAGATLRRDPSLAGARGLRRGLPVRPPPPRPHPAVPARRGRVRLHHTRRRRHGRPGRRRQRPRRRHCPRATAGGWRVGAVQGQRARVRPQLRRQPGWSARMARPSCVCCGGGWCRTGFISSTSRRRRCRPSRVLALLALLAERVGQGCQFIIATHSPILMALPGAAILLAEGGRPAPGRLGRAGTRARHPRLSQ